MERIVRQTVCAIVSTALFMSLGVIARAQQPFIPFQGQLTDQAGVPLSPTAPLTLVFRLYESPVGGAVLWEEVQSNVAVIGGRFSVLLGSRTAFKTTNKVKFDHTLYLGITVDDGDPSTPDVEMRPRQAIVPVIYATRAGDAEKLAGHSWSDVLVGGSNDPSSALIRADKIDQAEMKERLAALEKSINDQKAALAQQINDLTQVVAAIKGNVGTLNENVGLITKNWWEFGVNDGRTGTGIDFHGGTDSPPFNDYVARIYRIAGNDSDFLIENRGSGFIRLAGRTNIAGIELFLKSGNNGTVSADTYCRGSQWGITGVGIGMRRDSDGAFFSANETDPQLVNHVCICARLP